MRLTPEELAALEAEGIGMVEDDETIPSFDQITNAPLPSAGVFILKWPDPIGRDAYHGVTGDVIDALAPLTEADPSAMLVQFLTGIGNALGRRHGAMVGRTFHGTALQAMVLGSSGRGRKGTGGNLVLDVVKRADPSWADNGCIRSNLSTGEGMLHAVRDPKETTKTVKGETVTVLSDEGAKDKRLLVEQQEMGGALRAAQREGNQLTAYLRQAWDMPERIESLIKGSADTATEPVISVMGHLTSDDLHLLSDSDALNGTANRWLWVGSQRSKYLQGAVEIPEALMQDLARKIRAKLPTGVGRQFLTMTAEAEQLWQDRYPDLSTPPPGKLGTLMARGAPMVLRLAVIYAVLDGATQIDACHLRAGLAVWAHSAEMVRFLFADRMGATVAEKCIEIIRSHGRLGISSVELQHALALESSQDLNMVLRTLIEAGEIEGRVREIGGQLKQVWVLRPALPVVVPVPYEPEQIELGAPPAAVIVPAAGRSETAAPMETPDWFSESLD